ncbi:lectin C-type domain protein [Teladorsagia circumcincta]|uniref:Lectin C-type domain protein n=1 Tax=Teladorsagia circumcincta TaxID=45464 RepID=A0A2G9TTI5_TELCI|nr:lectin C-type domain protein [Teladorsagia circumcincta]
MQAVIFLTIICSAINGVSSRWVEWNDHSYKVYHWPATFDQAEAQCRSVGGHLASIHSEEENNFIHSLATTRRPQRSYKGFAWMGLRQASWPLSNRWTWTDGTPIYSDSGPGMYAVIEKYWNDMPCASRVARFVCKRGQCCS